MRLMTWRMVFVSPYPEARPGELVFLQGYRAATPEEVMAVHTKNYVRGLEVLTRMRAPLDIDSAPTYVTPSSYEEAGRLVDPRFLSLSRWYKHDGWTRRCICVPNFSCDSRESLSLYELGQLQWGTFIWVTSLG